MRGATMILYSIFILFALYPVVPAAKHTFERDNKTISFYIYNGQCAEKLAMRYRSLRLVSNDKFDSSNFNATIHVRKNLSMHLMVTMTVDVCTRSKHRDCDNLLSLEANFCDTLKYMMLRNIANVQYTCPIMKGTYQVTNATAEYMLQDYLSYNQVDKFFLRIREFVTDDKSKRIIHCNEINIFAD